MDIDDLDEAQGEQIDDLNHEYRDILENIASIASNFSENKNTETLNSMKEKFDEFQKVTSNLIKFANDVVSSSIIDLTVKAIVVDSNDISIEDSASKSAKDLATVNVYDKSHEMAYQIVLEKLKLKLIYYFPTIEYSF